MELLEAEKAAKLQPPLVSVRQSEPATLASPPAKPEKTVESQPEAADGSVALSGEAVAEETSPHSNAPSCSAPPAEVPASVPATPQQAIRMLAVDLYERARSADKPALFPSPSVQWGVVEAPRVAACLHASAVLIDCLKLFDDKAVPMDLLPIQQAAHRRSRQLAAQIANAFKMSSGPIPMSWQPADMMATVPVPIPVVPAPPQAPPPAPPPARPSLAFPSVPTNKQ